jgi:hypothetical protein
MASETETLDKLYLEIGQFSKARTRRELAYELAITKALFHLADATPRTRNGPCIRAIGILESALQSEKES